MYSNPDVLVPLSIFFNDHKIIRILDYIYKNKIETYMDKCKCSITIVDKNNKEHTLRDCTFVEGAYIGKTITLHGLWSLYKIPTRHDESGRQVISYTPEQIPLDRRQQMLLDYEMERKFRTGCEINMFDTGNLQMESQRAFPVRNIEYSELAVDLSYSKNKQNEMKLYDKPKVSALIFDAARLRLSTTKFCEANGQYLTFKVDVNDHIKGLTLIKHNYCYEKNTVLFTKSWARQHVSALTVFSPTAIHQSFASSENVWPTGFYSPEFLNLANWSCPKQVEDQSTSLRQTIEENLNGPSQGDHVARPQTNDKSVFNNTPSALKAFSPLLKVKMKLQGLHASPILKVNIKMRGLKCANGQRKIAQIQVLSDVT